MRRFASVSLLVLFLVAVVAGSASSRATTSQRLVAQERAVETYAAMQQSFYSPASKSYRGVYGRTTRAQAWPYSQALWATVGVAGLKDVGGDYRSDLLDRIGALSAYGRSEPGRVEYAPVYGGTGEVYYDDNLWIAMALVQAAKITKAPSSLAVAGRLFTLVQDGWDTKASDPCPGGVFWKRTGSNHDRNTVTSANSALLALSLYQETHVERYLAWAKRAYAWVQTCLGTPSGLVADHIDLAGTVDTHTWSYNQGAMIATGVGLYQATHDRSYLADAEKNADAALKKLGDPLASGEPAVFLAIFYRDLLQLSAVEPLRHDRAALATFANEAWAKARDPKTGLFRFGGNVPTLLDQAAMVQVYADLAAVSS